jgi:hypothetical protein
MRISVLVLITAMSAAHVVPALSQDGPVTIDVKTPMRDKEQLKLAKAGLVGYLRQVDWATIVNFGEDYAAVIQNLRRRLKGDSLIFSVEIELRTAVDLGSGTLLEKRTIRDTVDLSPLSRGRTFEEREVRLLVEEEVFKNSKYKPIEVALSTVSGVPIAGAVIAQGLKYVGVELNAKLTADEAVEAMVLGAGLFVNLKDMIDHHPLVKE